jgi:hypothetical protein
MTMQEKKYRVDSFDGTIRLISDNKAAFVKHVVSTHYYGDRVGNDVEKFVTYPDRTEIHILKEHDGTFELTHHEQIEGKAAGLRWLKSLGYTKAAIVDMDYTEYAYAGGTIGLYLIDNVLRSVILTYPVESHRSMEEKFGLSNADVIAVPYNKYLAKDGHLRSLDL